MIQDTSLKVLRIVLGEAMTTSNCDIVADFADFSLASSYFVWGNQNAHSNGTTPVDVVSAPMDNVQRQVKEIRLFNNDTVTHTVTLQLYDGTTTWIIAPSKVTVPPNGSFVYTPDAGVENTSTWNDGYVTALDPSLSIISGSLGVQTLAANTLFGNPTGSAARPTAFPIANSLTVASGTLAAYWNAGTVTALANSLTITAGTIAALSVGSGASVYNDVTATRGIGVVYTNTHGKPISVAASFHGTIGATFYVEVDGVQIEGTTQPVGGTLTCLNFIVPIGKTYKITISAGVATVDLWFELY